MSDESKQSLIDPDAPVPRKEFEALRAELKRPPWPMDYLGDEVYVRLSMLVDELLAKRVVITLRDLRADQWVQESTNLVDSLRWTRLVRQFLMKRHVPHKERGKGHHRYPYMRDARRIVEFQVPGSGPPILYAAYRDELHCAIAVAVGRERVAKSRKPQVIRRLREDASATDPKVCAQCQLQLRLAGEFSNTKDDASSSIQTQGEAGESLVSNAAPKLLSSPTHIEFISSSSETNLDDSSRTRGGISPLDGQPDAVTRNSRLSPSTTAVGDVGITDKEQRDRRATSCPGCGESMDLERVSKGGRRFLAKGAVPMGSVTCRCGYRMNWRIEFDDNAEHNKAGKTDAHYLLSDSNRKQIGRYDFRFILPSIGLIPTELKPRKP